MVPGRTRERPPGVAHNPQPLIGGLDIMNASSVTHPDLRITKGNVR